MKKEDLKLIIHQHKSNFKPQKPGKKEMKSSEVNLKLLETSGAFTQGGKVKEKIELKAANEQNLMDWNELLLKI